MLKSAAVYILSGILIALLVSLLITGYLLKKSRQDNAILTTNNSILADAIDKTKETLAEERVQNKKDREAIQSANQAQAQITHEKIVYRDRLVKIIDESGCIDTQYSTDISSLFPGKSYYRTAN